MEARQEDMLMSSTPEILMPSGVDQTIPNVSGILLARMLFLKARDIQRERRKEQCHLSLTRSNNANFQHPSLCA